MRLAEVVRASAIDMGDTGDHAQSAFSLFAMLSTGCVRCYIESDWAVKTPSCRPLGICARKEGRHAVGTVIH
jgi:hypothetical protein